MTRRSCASCGTPWADVWPACEACGCPAAVATVEPDDEPAPPSSPAPHPVPLSDARALRVRMLGTGDGDVDTALGGGLAACGAYLVTGGPGAGKTTLALRALARHRGVLLSCEMPPPVVRILCERAGIPTSGIGVVVPDTFETAIAAVAAAHRLVVIDSLGRLPGRPDPVFALGALLDVTQAARLRGALCLFVIAQQTKAGDARGSRELQHDVDGVIELEKDEVRVPKHRLGDAETRARACWSRPASATK